MCSNQIYPIIDSYLNTLRPRQNWRHFADDILKYTFFNENVWIPIKISLKFVSKGRINNIPALVQIMAWRRPGDTPLSEPMLVSLPTHLCVTRPQWVNSYYITTLNDICKQYFICLSKTRQLQWVLVKGCAHFLLCMSYKSMEGFPVYDVLYLIYKWKWISHDSQQPSLLFLTKVLFFSVTFPVECITCPYHWAICGWFTGTRNILRHARTYCNSDSYPSNHCDFTNSHA